MHKQNKPQNKQKTNIPDGKGGLGGIEAFSILFKLFSFCIDKIPFDVERLTCSSNLSLALSTTFLASFKLKLSNKVPFI